jgi:hypothetical protein
MSRTRWICVHGHFYQPPRENPWLEVIEPQPSAKPYQDWNARITAECYRPNAWARIVDGDGAIIRIVDNYERISFNVGPTLLAWLEREAPDVHAALVDADRKSRARFGGHGSAIAQAYNHSILPLENRRDKVTQVRWGLADFRRRFGRDPEAMWLPECAVDVESLEVLAEHGLAYVILSPGQAARWRPIAEASRDPSSSADRSDVAWQTGAIDPSRVYRCSLPSGRSIDAVFYDGPISQAVAFERLLADGGQLVARLAGAGRDGGLSHIATDGETYGHHHRYGDMALAWALTTIETGSGAAAGARLTNYGEHRARRPATWEVEVVSPSAWSCAHGVGRWREDCGCNTGGGPGWRQGWRAPLRAALDWLRDRAAAAFERAAAGVLRDPWAARDDYIDVVLDRRLETIDRFLRRHVDAAELTDDVRRRALVVMELQRNAMLMFTSCGWFFDDLAGIETIQILQYAARVCELVRRAGGDDLEPELLDRLAQARSNRPDEGDGRQIWARHVAPARFGLADIVAHVVVQALVEPGPAAAEDACVFCYDVAFVDRLERRTGKARLVAGTVRVRSRLTFEAEELRFAGLHFGEHHLIGGVRAGVSDRDWAGITAELAAAFGSADLLGAQRILDRSFPDATVSLGSLRGADRARVVGRMLAEPLAEVDAAFERIYDEYAPLMRWLDNHHLPVPEPMHTAAEYTLRRRLLRNLASPQPRFAEVIAQIGEATHVEVDLDTPEVAFAAAGALAALVERLIDHPDDLGALESAARGAEVASRMRTPVDLWRVQNAGMKLVERHLAPWRTAAAAGDPAAELRARWLTQLAAALKLSTGPAR